MCGIWAIFGIDTTILPHFIPAYNSIKHRGPDAWRIENDHHFKNCSIGFHRLAIVDDMYGMQPMRIKRYPHVWILCNGEIYNHEKLKDEFGFEYETKCDVEAIVHLYVKGGAEWCASQLDGVFAFCILDTEKAKVFLGRDTYGVRPAFQLTTKEGFLAISSEAKGLMDLTKGLNGCKFELKPVLPGVVQEFDLLESGRVKHLKKSPFHSIGRFPKYQMFTPPQELGNDIEKNIRRLFTAAVKKRLMAQRRIGCLLSGGLDSSLVAATLLRLADEVGLKYKVQTFAIGMEDSPDVMAARKVAEHIRSEHHEVIIQESDVISAIDRVVYHLESYDITTVRASIGMFLLSEYISKQTNTIVIFSGEGADELGQGYIYFRNAPTAQDGDGESRRLLHDLYLYDVLRSDRTTAAHGLEMRVPFLDHQLTAYYLSLPAELRQPKDGKVEKYLLRKSFDGTGLLPDEILWRQKEAFSDGVASVKRSLFTVIHDYVSTKVSDEELERADVTYPLNTPKTKEALYYRKVFEKNYPGMEELIPYFWMPKWCEGVSDPSARFINHYNKQEA
ncbi:hypothetical protein CHUAL_000227 [Chamberlinius hualienensis]